MRRKVLILGVSGMVGSMMFYYFNHDFEHSTSGTVRIKKKNAKGIMLFEVEDFLLRSRTTKKYAFLSRFDYIINCIGILKPGQVTDSQSVKDAIIVNSLFPHDLADFVRKSKVRIIHITTDGVYSGKGEKYGEDSVHDAQDTYGNTKSLGEVVGRDVLNIRCSIIGPELGNKKKSLFEWFISHDEDDTITGCDNYFWNGVTSLQLARLCREIIQKDMFDKLVKQSSVHHFFSIETISKYTLLCMINKIFHLGYTIKRGSAEDLVSRSLFTRHKMLSSIIEFETTESDLIRLKGYMQRNRLSLYAGGGGG